MTQLSEQVRNALFDFPEAMELLDQKDELIGDLLEACNLAFDNLRPRGDIRKDFDGHVTMAALGAAIHKASQ